MNSIIVIGIVVMSLTVRKTQGQLATAPRSINVRILYPFPLDPRTVIVSERAPLLPQVIPQQNTVLRSSTDRLDPSDISDSDFNLRPSTLGSRRRLFIPERSPARTSQPDIGKIDSDRSNFGEINNPVNNQGDINPNGPNNGRNRSNLVEQKGTSPETTIQTNEPGDTVIAAVQNDPSVNRSSVNGSKQVDRTTGSGKPTSPTVVDKATGVEVTLDERASFDGDKCPTGYVRINGMCVEKD